MRDAARATMRTNLAATAPQVAPGLLGATLRSDVDGATVVVRITEVEAYEGFEDPASHAYRGLTARTAVMFGPAGHLYCYFVYGMHWCANIVTGPDGAASAVLLRAGAVVDGEAPARARSASRAPQALVTGRTTVADGPSAALASGPARLARVLGLNGAHNGVDLLDDQSPIRLLGLAPPVPCLSGPRVGVSQAGEIAWRFWLADEPSVSRYRSGARKQSDRPGLGMPVVSRRARAAADRNRQTDVS